MSEGLPPRGGVVALQDRDCIDRLKFRYALSEALPAAFFDQFRDAKVVIRRFSEIVPLGRDLFNITKPSCFRADGIVGDRKITVVFNGSPRRWPERIVEDFGQRLIAAGFSTIAYRRDEPPKCAGCALRASKKCQGDAAT